MFYIFTNLLKSLSYVNAFVNNKVEPYQTKNNNVNVITSRLFISISSNNGFKNPINIQNSKVVIKISVFCNEDK